MIAAIQILATLGVIAACWMALPKRRDRRGRELLNERRVRRTPKEARGREGERLFWGGRGLPPGAETTHFLVLGTTGSGKTLTLGGLMKQVLPNIGVVPDHRALIYDAKQDVLSFLHGLKLACPVKILNPFDERSAAWDMGVDVTAPATALQVATALIPEENGNNRFFSDAARDLVTGLQISFIRNSPAAWTFSDLVHAASNKERIRLLLERSPEGQDLLEAYFAEEKTLHNIVSTIRSRLAPFEAVAGLWQRAKERVSLREWTEGEFVLVLGNDESVRAAIDAVNRVMFKRISELVLARSESSERRSWFFLDEVREAGRLNGLSSLLLKGRSKGAAVFLGFQDVEGMKEVYGDHSANEIMGMCSNKAILRLESPETADWAARVLGEYEEVEVLRSVNTDWSWWRRNRTQSEHRRRTHAVMASEFLTLPPASVKSGLSGYYLSPHLGAFRATVAAEIVEKWKVVKRDQPDVLPRSDEQQYLRAWDRADHQRLGIRLELERREPKVIESGGASKKRVRLVRRSQAPA